MGLPAIYGALSDVWNATTNPAPQSLVPGFKVYHDNSGRIFEFVQANGSINQYDAVKRDPSVTTAGYVISTAAVGDAIEGTNDQSGGNRVSGDQFWITFSGDCTINLAASISAGKLLGASATGGTLQAASASNIDHIRSVALAASGGGGGATACRLY